MAALARTMRADGGAVVDVSRTSGSVAPRPGSSVLQVTETLWAWAKYRDATYLEDTARRSDLPHI